MIGTTLKQRFFLERELGRGGMGAVYRAVDQVLQRPVAIKVLRDLSGEEVGRKLRLEAQILARLLHDQIVRLYDFDEEAGTFYFIMEEVDGESYFKRRKALSLARRLEVLALMAEALDYAHRQGIIHRDVKPGNILLTRDDRPKLSDFGLSMLVDDAQETGVARGTPLYMSPEQARGRRIDTRSDLYALGVLLYEGMTDSLPFQGNPLAVMAQQINDEPEPPTARNPELSAAMEDLILRLMAKDPEARPHSGAAVAEELRSMMADGRWTSSAAEARLAATIALPVAADPGDTLVRPGAAALGKPAAGAAPTPSSKADRDRREADRMLDDVVEDPIVLSPEQRYLSGHYLAYLLGGSRREGIFLRRPLDPLNADRGRLLLAMTWLMLGDGSEADVKRAARLLDRRPDVRTRLSPIVVVKYLLSREQPRDRKRFRQLRQALQQASPYAREHMTDRKGLLNPGLMPQVLSDLRKIAPERTEVDDELVGRWNRLTELWRDRPDFRRSVLRYATLNAADDPASPALWPEVVCPLIERARWQRRLRTRAEDFWDVVAGKIFQVPPPGLRMDRAFDRDLPRPAVAELDESLIEFEDNPEVLDDLLDEDRGAGPSSGSISGTVRVSSESIRELAADVEVPRGFVPLAEPDPVRLSMGELRDLYRAAIANLRSGNGQKLHDAVPVGPYRLAVVASIRARTAGTVAIQGMPNKQIELLVPSFSGSGSNSRPILAAWHYENRSLVAVHVDPRGISRYTLWDAATGRQSHYDEAADLNHALLQHSMESPDQIDRVLTARYQPRSSSA